jgi:hypothetical protein
MTIDKAVLRMVNSGKYVFSFQWAAAQQGHGMDASKAALLWKSRCTPEEMTLEEVQALIFSTAV